MTYTATADEIVSNNLQPNDQIVYIATWARGSANFGAAIIALFSYPFLQQMSVGGLGIGGVMLLWAFCVWQAPKYKRVILTDRRLIFEHSFGTGHETVPVDKIEKVTVTGQTIEVAAGSIFNKMRLNLVDGKALAAALDVLVAANQQQRR